MNGDFAEELLREYLAATDEDPAERRLEDILERVARPLAQRVVSSVVRTGDTEDVVADTLMDLLRRLRDLRGDVSQPIHDLRRYIVTCAYNRCHERLRERYPARNRLRNQLRYLFTHERDLALWRNTDGEWICGFRDWAGREPVGGERLDDVCPIVRGDPSAENRVQVASLVPVLLRGANGPLTLDTLSSVIARLIGVDQQRSGMALTKREPSKETPADEALEQRMSLRQLWDDVRRLALNQRIALLLNLRDVHGRECLTLLPLTRTATIAEIADIVGMQAEEFARLWNRLPLSDAAIAAMLDMTPRQVIKLRRLARERLRRIDKARNTDQNLRRNLDSSSNGAILTKR